MTKKLYWETPYETSFSAEVVAIKDDGVVLDKTLFYPESGNQASDKGFLKLDDSKFKVDNVTKEGEGILHHLGSDFEDKINVGDNIEGEIDWKYRYGLMIAHSSQHIFSAVIKNEYDIDTIRANLNFEEVSIQISQKLNYEQLKKIFNKVNEISTSSNLNINSTLIPYEDAQKKSSKIRSKIPKEPIVRLMEIEGLDMVCCGGTHVSKTSEIGHLYIYEFKKGKEIGYFVGKKANQFISNNNIDMVNLANDTNTSIENLKENLEKQLQITENLQNQQKNLMIKFLEATSKSPTKVIKGISIFYIEYNIDFKLLNKSLSNFPQNSLIIVNMGNNKIRINSLSDSINADELIQLIIKKYNGKGGGNPKSAQVALETAPKNLIAQVELLLFSE
ncbi:MAG: alanyl-tRNA editing protein [Promethearchaeota archaeon]|jgi:alanyl-tRNA synthetase